MYRMVKLKIFLGSLDWAFDVEEKGALVDQVILELGFLFRTEFFQNILCRSISIIL